MLILVVLPVILVAILGHALRFQLLELKFGVVDRSNTAQSREIISTLDRSDEFTHFKNLLSEQQIEESFISDDLKFVIYLPKELHRGEQVQFFIDGSDLFLSEAIVQKISSLTAKEQVEYSFKYNPKLNWKWSTLPGLVMVSLIIVSTIMLGMSLNREREQGSARLLLISPASMGEVIAGKGAPYLVVSLLHTLSIFFLLRLLYGVGAGGTFLPFILITLLFSINSMAFGLFVAALVKDELQLLIGCWLFLFIPNLFFSGFIYPVQSMHPAFIWVAQFMPGTLFIESFKSILFKDLALKKLLYPLTLLLLQSIVLITISQRLLNRNFFKK